MGRGEFSVGRAVACSGRSRHVDWVAHQAVQAPAVANPCLGLAVMKVTRPLKSVTTRRVQPVSRQRYALLALLLTLLAACSGAAVTAKVDGRTVENLQEAETLADRRFLSDVTIEGATIGNSARCFFSRNGKADAPLRNSVFCGPVRHFGDMEPTLWDSYPLAQHLGSQPSTLRVYVVGDPDRNVRLPDAANLFRFDGHRPEGSAALSPPGVPRVPANYATVLTSDPEVPLRPVTTEIPLGVRAGIRVLGLGEVDQLGTREGQRRAPTGARLVVARVEQYGDGEGLPVLLSADVDGRRSELGEVGERREGWAAVAVPVAAGRAEMTVTRQTFSGVVSLRTGAVVSTGPSPIPTATVPLDAKFPREDGRAELGGVLATANLSQYSVTAARLSTFSEWVGFADQDKAWLIVHFDSLPRPLVYNASFSAPLLDDTTVVLDTAKSFQFAPATGEPVSAVDVGRPDAGATAGVPGPEGHDVFFLVPKETRAGALRIAPTFSISARVGQATANTSIGFTPREVPLKLS